MRASDRTSGCHPDAVKLRVQCIVVFNLYPGIITEPPQRDFSTDNHAGPVKLLLENFLLRAAAALFINTSEPAFPDRGYVGNEKENRHFTVKVHTL